MKKHLRIPLLLLIAILLLALCGCSAYHTPTAGMVSTKHENGPTYTLDFQKETILYNGTLCHYSVTRNKDDISYTISYPNGGVYYYNSVGNVVSSGGNEDYDEVNYPSGETLVDLLRQYYFISHSAPNFGHYLMLLICLGFGAFDLFFPEDAWYWSHMFRSWQYESVEPSEAGITWTRVGGVIIIIVGIIGFFSNWS